MGVSQKQIAQKLGVSVALVSRVLSGRAAEIGIASATIDRVRRAADEMGYVANASALSLKGKPTRTIGLATADYADPFMAEIVGLLSELARDHHYSVVLLDQYAPRKHAVDGVILFGAEETDADWLAELMPVPIVRIGHGDPEDLGCCVAVNVEDAVAQLINYLSGIGRSRFHFVGSNCYLHQLRFRRLEEYADRAGLSFSASVVDLFGFEAGQRAAERLLVKQLSADALVCASDEIAMGVIHELVHAGVAVPEDVAVTGFGDIASAEWFLPPLTTFRIPIIEMVERAFLMVTGLDTPRDLFLAGNLILRQTA